MMDIKSRVEDIIEIYNKTETELNYKRRSENESSNIKSVLKAIQDNKFRLRSTQSKEDFISILKAADNISLDIGTNYLEQFLKLPDVQKVIDEKLNQLSLLSDKHKALENERSGNLPKFGKIVSEIDKNAANRYLSLVEKNKGITAEEEMNNIEKYIKAKIETGADLFSLKTNANTLEEIPKVQNLQLRFARVMIRQQGMNPGDFEIKDGKVQFEIDVKEKEPISQGMRQEQGVSIAKQEEMKNEQRAKQDYDDKQKKKENKKAADMFRDKAKFSESLKVDNGNTHRTNNKENKKAVDMFRGKAKFSDSLKVHNENTHRTNILQGNNNSRRKNQNKGMGMER